VDHPRRRSKDTDIEKPFRELDVMRKTVGAALFLVGALSLAAQAVAFSPDKPECLAPAKPGGGFDLTCRLVVNALLEAGLIERPMQITFMPGGIGAAAYSQVINARPDDPNLIVAASTGTALLLAQGRYGKYDETAVRWLAALGTDYGAIVVRADTLWQSLGELVADLKKDPSSVIFGAGGWAGSQDWLKAVLIARTAGIDPQKLRYVAYEGGGESIAALMGGHIQVYTGDVAEMSGRMEDGKFRILAVLAEERLPEEFSDVPTAKEQGFDVVWPTWRGYYMGPKVSDEAYNWWVETFKKLVETPEYTEQLKAQGLYSFTKIGAEFDAFVKEQVEELRRWSKRGG
jgi:putative tricarboxylic transport membrane protein